MKRKYLILKAKGDVIAEADSFGHGGGFVAVADLTEFKRAVAIGLDLVEISAHADSEQDGIRRAEGLFTSLDILNQYTLGGDADALAVDERLGGALFEILLVDGGVVQVGRAKADLVAHFHDRDAFALLLENETLFGALRATADDDDIFADFDGADFVDGVDHRQISTGEGGLDGMCADGKNDDVGTKSLCIFGRHESVHAKINIALFDLADLEVEIAAVFILERRFHDNVDQTAEMIGFFAQRDIVSALCGGEGGLHTAGAAADDENLLAWAGRHNVDLPLAAEHGVDGAFADVRVERSIVRRTVCTGDAGAAAQAGDDLIFVAMVGLVDPARVGKECTTGGDHINFAAGDGLVSLLEVADTTNSTDGRLDSGLDGGSKGDIDAALGKHAGEELAAGGIEERGRGDVDQINLAVEHLGKFNALFGAEAAFHEVVCGETVFDG